MASSLVVAVKVIEMLLTRSGFDFWWERIDDEIQDEIITEIATVINEGEEITQ